MSLSEEFEMPQPNLSKGILGNPDPREARLKAADERALTARDLEMIQYMADGDGYAVIAAKMITSEQVIKQRVQRARDAVSAPNAVNLVAICLRRGLID